MSIVITIKDVAKILGYSYKQAQKIHQQVRDSLNKNENQFLAISEFAEYTGLPVSDIEKTLSKKQ